MILIVDGHHLVHTFYGVANTKGEVDVADTLERFCNRMDRIHEFLERFNTKCYCVFDNSMPTFRHWIFDDYKAGRKRDESLVELLRACEYAVNCSSDWNGIKASYGFESDDVMASVAAQSKEKVLIHAADKDLHQCLVPGRVTICKSSRINFDRKPEMKYVTAETLKRKFKFGVDRWVDYQALIGDSADNIIGAVGVGPVKATELILKYEDLNDVREEDLNKTQKENWPDFISRLPLLMKLLTLKTEMDLPESLLTKEDVA